MSNNNIISHQEYLKKQQEKKSQHGESGEQYLPEGLILPFRPNEKKTLFGEKDISFKRRQELASFSLAQPHALKRIERIEQEIGESIQAIIDIGKLPRYALYYDSHEFVDGDEVRSFLQDKYEEGLPRPRITDLQGRDLYLLSDEVLSTIHFFRLDAKVALSIIADLGLDFEYQYMGNKLIFYGDEVDYF